MRYNISLPTVIVLFLITIAMLCYKNRAQPGISYGRGVGRVSLLARHHLEIHSSTELSSYTWKLSASYKIGADVLLVRKAEIPYRGPDTTRIVDRVKSHSQ